MKIHKGVQNRWKLNVSFYFISVFENALKIFPKFMGGVKEQFFVSANHSTKPPKSKKYHDNQPKSQYYL